MQARELKQNVLREGGRALMSRLMQARELKHAIVRVDAINQQVAPHAGA